MGDARGFSTLTMILLGAVAAGSGCHAGATTDSAGVEPTAEVEAQSAEGAPRWCELASGTSLFAEPGEPDPSAELGGRGDGGGAVEVVEVVEGWWRVRALDPAEAARFGAEAIAGLRFYDLELWVRAGSGRALYEIPVGPDFGVVAGPDFGANEGFEPAKLERVSSSSGGAQDLTDMPGVQEVVGEQGLGVLGALASDPPLQSGERRPTELSRDYRVVAGAPVFWPDGREAGEVRRDHAFISLGDLRQTPSGAIRCFAARVHVGSEAQLCYRPGDVVEGEPLPAVFGVGILGELDPDEDVWGGLTGEEIGEAYGVGGLGLVGTGTGGGGTGSGTIGLGRLGTTGVGALKVVKVAGAGGDDAAHVEAQAGALGDCYAAVAGSEPGVVGSRTLTVEVGKDGAVAKVRVSGADDTLRACLERVVDGWELKHSASSTVTVELDYAR